MILCVITCKEGEGEGVVPFSRSVCIVLRIILDRKGVGWIRWWVDVAMFKVSREIYEPLKDRFNGNLIARGSASFRTMIIKYNKMLDAIRFFRMFLFPLDTNDNAMRDGG